MTSTHSGVRLCLLMAGAGLLFAPIPRALGAAPLDGCGQLAKLEIPGTTIVGAQSIEAGTFKPPKGDPIPNLPAFCRLSAVAKPSSDSDIKFEVWMPAAGWNGRLWAIGNLAFAGSIIYWELGGDLAEGYAVVGTDAGHQGGLLDSSWAVGHPEKVIDNGFRAIHEVTASTKRIIAAFYGRKPTHSYFCGCSDGGREGLMEAQRYPDDYDGIIAGAPAIEDVPLDMAWQQFAWLGDGASYIPTSKLAAIQAAALAACDRIDGIVDGIIGDPQRCTFDPGTLACNGAETDRCLTQAQLMTLRRLYAGAVRADGSRVFHGYSPGAEAEPEGWGRYITGSGPGKSFAFQMGLGYMRDFVYGDPKWDFHSFNPERDAQIAHQKLAAISLPSDPDLSRFVARGGKLILYHGWNDAAIPALATVDYYQRVIDTIGEEKANKGVRLFMAPGMLHCDSGPGPNSFGQWAAGAGDPSTKIGAALQRWAEEGIAPERIIASKRKNDDDDASEVIRRRPLCAYPNVTHFRGQGSTDSAASFDCSPAP